MRRYGSRSCRSIVGCRVSQKIYFDEYEFVHKGDTLLLIEDTEFRLRVAQAEADYQNALAGRSAMGTAVSTAHNNLAVSDAGIDEVEVLLKMPRKIMCAIKIALRGGGYSTTV